MKGRQPNDALNFICLTCDGIFPYIDRVNDKRANKKMPLSRIKVPIMCKECFSKLK